MVKKLGSLILLMVLAFVSVGCAGINFDALTGANAVATQSRLTGNLKEMRMEYPNAVVAISNHAGDFSADEIKDMKSLDVVFSYVINTLEAFDESSDIEKVTDFDRMYDNLEFAWRTITGSYTRSADVINAHEADFSPDEMLRLRLFDQLLVTIDGDVRKLIKISEESDTQVKDLVATALEIATMIVTVKAAIDGDESAIISALDAASAASGGSK